MFKKNFNKIVLGFSLLTLSVGFLLSYFSEPTKEEKVLRALNYDMRFTKKVATHEAKRKPTSDQFIEKAAQETQTTQSLSVEQIYKTFEPFEKYSIDEKWDLVNDVFAFKNNGEQPTIKDSFEYKGYTIFTADNRNASGLGNTNLFKLVLNKKTKKVGFLTGSLVITLKPGVNAKNFWQDYNVTVLDYFENSQILIVSPNVADELFEIKKIMATDLSVEKVEIEILSRFIEKR